MTYENFGNIIRNMWRNILDTIKEQRWITSGNLGNIIRNMLQIIQGDTIVQNRCGHGKLWERHREHLESIWDLQLSDTLRTVWDQDMGTNAMQTPCGIKYHANRFLVQIVVMACKHVPLESTQYHNWCDLGGLSMATKSFKTLYSHMKCHQTQKQMWHPC